MSVAALAAPTRLRTSADDLDDLLALWLRRPPRALSAREWEVAVLVTRGCSNRDIADELIVSQRTVDTHVSHILRKLGLSSRAQIGAWVVVEHQRSSARLGF
jgi:DNA-binding NarL/FixJ family response regulator